jgi:hypothetical protein
MGEQEDINKTYNLTLPTVERSKAAAYITM